MEMINKHTPVVTNASDYGLLSTSEFDELEETYVLRVLRKKRVFRYTGKDKEESEAYQLERLYQQRVATKHCLAVNAGTSALVAAMVGAEIGPGDEVIVPGYTYIATAAAVLIARAVPVIVEVDDTLTMDPKAFEAAITPHTKAVIPVHMRGVPAQMDEILDVARRHHLIVIEDVAQANGGSYKGNPLGSMGHAGCFSFQQYKLITAGEGGMVATNDDNIFRRARIYHDSALAFWDSGLAKDNGNFVGENYRMSELNAALALAQSQRIDALVSALRHIKTKIIDGIKDLPQIVLQRIPDPEGDVSYSLLFYLPTAEHALRFSDLLKAEGVMNGTINQNNGIADRHIYKNWSYVLQKRGSSEKDNPWNCASYRGSVQYSENMCPNTLNWLSRAVAIGLHQRMTEQDTDDIISAIRNVSSHF